MNKKVFLILLQSSSSLKNRIKEFLEEEDFEIRRRVKGEEKKIIEKDLIEIKGDSKDLAELWKRTRNIIDKSVLKRYINRVFIVNRIENNYEQLIKTLKIQLKDKTTRIIAYPKELEKNLLMNLEKNIKLNPKSFNTVLYVIKTKKEYYYGIYNKKYYYKPNHQKENEINRAYYKIKEAMKRFRIDINKIEKVLDLGAAPGGWSYYMLNKNKIVIAVDPAELKIKHKNLIHIKKKLQDSIENIRKYAPYDLIMCDINENPLIIAKEIIKLKDFLSENGVLVFTIKLVYKNPKNQEKLIKETINALKPHFKEIKIKWLLSNSKYERTLYAK